MGKLLSLIRRAPKRTSAIVMMLAAAIIIPSTLFAWGPSRETFTIEHPATYPTFNSITNNPAQGDERNFVRIKESTASDSAFNDDQSLTPGKEYTVYVYYHNDAASNLNASGKGIAKDVTLRTEIPALVKAKSNDTKAVGYINASNTTPLSVWDHVNLDNATDGDIALRIVPGSASIHNFGPSNGTVLSDSIVSTGVKLGYEKPLDGTIPGCNEYSGYVIFKLKAEQANFTVSKQVRVTGTSAWTESVNANPGTSVDYLVTYKNTGTTRQNDVVIKDVLPTGLTYVNGSTKLANATNPSGLKVSDNVTKSTGINIGNYDAGANAFVMFSAKVNAKETLTCGVATLHNIARAETNNGSKEDSADVVVPAPDCKYITVCELATKKIISIKDTEFDSKKHSKNLNDCKTPETIIVCELSTKKIITINESAFDSKKHSKNLNDCKMTVCDLTTKTIITIDGNAFDSKKHSTDLSLCNSIPELPHTGTTENIVAFLGLGSLIASIAYYVASRRVRA